jgi:hypothetical protein
LICPSEIATSVICHHLIVTTTYLIDTTTYLIDTTTYLIDATTYLIVNNAASPEPDSVTPRCKKC